MERRRKYIIALNDVIDYSISKAVQNSGCIYILLLILVSAGMFFKEVVYLIISLVGIIAFLLTIDLVSRCYFKMEYKTFKIFVVVSTIAFAFAVVMGSYLFELLKNNFYEYLENEIFVMLFASHIIFLFLGSFCVFPIFAVIVKGIRGIVLSKEEDNWTTVDYYSLIPKVVLVVHICIALFLSISLNKFLLTEQLMRYDEACIEHVNEYEDFCKMYPSYFSTPVYKVYDYEITMYRTCFLVSFFLIFINLFRKKKQD